MRVNAAKKGKKTYDLIKPYPTNYYTPVAITTNASKINLI